MTMQADTVTDTAPRILCVDDEPNILSALRRLFRAKGYEVVTAHSGKEGLEILENEHIDLVISDMRMPEMDGAQFLKLVCSKWPDCMRILLTGYSDVQSIVDAVNEGEIYRYIAKPWDENDMILVVHHALERKYLLDEKLRLEKLTRDQNEQLKSLNATLEEKVSERTARLKSANEKLKENFITSIKVFSSLIEMRGGKLAGHSRRVAYLARKIAHKLNLSATEVQDIFVAGLLANVGKIGFTDELLAVPVNQLSRDQLGLYHKHTVRAEQVLTPFEDLQMTAKILRSQHERVDGHGFPDGLAADNILIGSRILSVAIDYDNFQTGVMGQRKMLAEEAQAMIIRGAGSRYDENVVAAFKDIFNHHVAEPVDDYEVPIVSLRKGMVLSVDLISHDGVLLLPADYVLTEGLVQKIALHTASAGGQLSVRVRSPRKPVPDAIKI